VNRATPSIVQAGEDDRPEIQGLLESSGLPGDDIATVLLDGFLVVRHEERLGAVVGLELLEDVALLRSLVVHPELRHQGLGRDLVVAAEWLARQRRVQMLYLLTTDARSFFEALGYRALARSRAPLSIAELAQFRLLCPSTATLMRKSLKDA
jgi:amino-acid N-acetyltransferase